MSFLQYKPPKTLRILFIIHYAPLLLIITIGPQSVLFNFMNLFHDPLFSIVTGLIIFLLGSILYFKWEWFWHKTYHGQLVTTGIFQYIRHPHYTSLLIIGYGLALFFNSIPALIIATIAIPIMMICCTIINLMKVQETLVMIPKGHFMAPFTVPYIILILTMTPGYPN